jgi:hypothetical protein
MYKQFYEELELNQSQGDQLFIDSHNAAAFKASQNVVEFYTCYPTSLFNTFCEFKTSMKINEGVGTFKPLLKPFNDLFFGLETFLSEDEKTVESTNLWYWGAGEGWNYENYPGEIKEVAHIYSQEGRIYLGLMTQSTMNWALFSSDWALGSHKFQTFTHEDVDSNDFCPIKFKTGYENST